MTAHEKKSLKKRRIEMKDLTFKVLLGIISVNLTIQTVKDVGLFPTAYAQVDIQRVAVCEYHIPLNCASILDADGVLGFKAID